MATTENKQNQPARSGRDNFERMLELEQRNRVNPMQASSYASSQIPPSYTNTGLGQDSRSDLERRPRTRHRNGRAMTTPNLSLSIPVTEQMSGSIKYIISSHGDIVPQQEEQDSDASSICNSPGWDDIGGKKRKKEKEKERKEKEKIESAKLHKAPPRKRLSKIAAMTDQSAPVVPVLPIVQDVVEPVEAKKKPGDRLRRGSLELGLRSLLHAKKAISTPWRSSHATPTTPAKEISPIPTSTSGFIGGLKLRQSEEANTQEVMRKLKLAQEDEGKGLLNNERDVSAKLGEASSSTSFTESTAPASIYAESFRTPSQWDSIHAQAALMASTPADRIVDDKTPIMERNIRKGRKSHPPTSRYFESEESRSRRDLSRSSNRSSYPSDGQASSVSSPTTNLSSIPTDHPEDLMHRRSSSYIPHSRQQSQDQLVNDNHGNHAVAGAAQTRKSESRGRSIFNRSRSRSRNPSNVRPGTGEGKEKDEANPSLRKDDPAAQLHLGQTTESPTESSFMHRRRSSFASSSGVKGLRNAARAAFSKNSGSIHSGSDTYSSAEILTATPFRPQTANRAATTDVATLRTIAPDKVERILGEQIPSTLIQELPPRVSNRKYAPRVVHKDQSNSATSSSSSQVTGKHWAHSRSSSDEYSTPDEYSNVTTPTMSRSHSENGYFPKMEDANEGSNTNMSTTSIDQPKDAYLMTGAIPVDEATESGREDWSRTVMPMEVDDEESRKTPTPQAPSVPQLPDGLNRQPSLSRSVSTPELQDLSFLPALKHQALTSRPQEKSKSKKTRSRAERSPKASTRSLSEPLAMPSPPTTKSEGSSPTSPLSSQYLKNARLSLPHPANKPFAHSSLQQGGARGSEPVAKMIVVCCSCKYFHDMPSKIYECMAKPDNIVQDTLGVSGVLSTAVKCPWCGHGMSTKCCAGYVGLVYLTERLH